MSDQGTYVEKSFERDTNYITTRITADGREGFPVESGRYRAYIVLTMAGDWVILAHVTLPDGPKLDRQIEVNGVGRTK